MSDHLPSIFDSRGAFIEIPDEHVEKLSDAQRAVYEKNKRCAADLRVAESKAAAAIESVKTCFDAVTEFEKIIAAIPQPAFMDLWRESKATRASGQ
jgi:hypothetical protein